MIDPPAMPPSVSPEPAAVALRRVEPPLRYEPGGPAEGVAAQLKPFYARRWAFAGTFTVVLGLFAVHSFQRQPIYEATAVLLIEPRKAKVVAVQEIYDSAGGGAPHYYETQYDLLASRRVAERALARLAHDEELPLPGVERFMAATRIRPRHSTRLVQVIHASAERQFAARAANAIMEAYIEDTLQRHHGLSDTGLLKLRSRAAELQPKVAAAQDALQRFEQQHGLIGGKASEAVLSRQLAVLNQKLAEVRERRIAGGSLDRITREPLDPEKLSGLAIQGEQLETYRKLKVRVLELEAELQGLRRRYKHDHPYLKPPSATLRALRAALAAEKQAILSRVAHRLERLRSEEQTLAQEVRSLEQRLAVLKRARDRYNLLRQSADTLHSTYRRILQRVEDVDLAATTAPKDQNLFVIERARPPVEPVSPRTWRDLGLGALFGLICAVGLVRLLERLDNTLKTREEVERILGAPVVGALPRIAGRAADLAQAAGPPLELLSLRESDSLVAEAFRSIRTGLGFTMPSREARTLLVTSAMPGEGKSFVATNLAIALARTGVPVLLIDADMRLPRQHRLFGLPEQPGLSNTLAAAADALLSLEAVQPTCMPGLDLLPAGEAPPNPAELLGSEAMGRLIERAAGRYAGRYAWVVVDAPPLNAVADPAVLMTHVSNVLFVVRSYYTTREAALCACQTLQQTPGRIVSVVLNNLDVPAGLEDPAGEYYAYYAEYRRLDRSDRSLPLPPEGGAGE